MSKLLVIIIALSSYLNVNAQKKFEKISFAVNKKSNITGRSKRVSFHDVRMYVYKEKHPDFLDADIDTLFILEKYSIDDATFSGKIWSAKDSITYIYHAKKLNYSVAPFTKYMCSLIKTWDTAQIRLEESLYSNLQPSYRIYGTRIIKTSDGYKIDTISFMDFFKVERDGTM